MVLQEYTFDGLHVEVYQGSNGGHGSPLLFVHGAWSGSWIFGHWMEYMAAGNWNCYAINLRGHYKSPPFNLGGVTQWDYARDVLRIARRLPAPPVLVGFGTGAHLVQLALSKGFPARGAAFISAKLPNIRVTELPPEVYQLPHLMPAEPLPEAPDLRGQTLQWMNELLSQTVEPRAALIALLKGEVQTLPDFVRVPFLVLNGALDEQITPQQGQELVDYYHGQGKLEIVPDTSHEGILMGDYWREGADALNRWLMENGFHRQ